MPNQTAVVDRITFNRNGQIKRGKIRVGWIDYYDYKLAWEVRFTPASGIAGFYGRYARLRDAKEAAREALAKNAVAT
jgi:hypothetical protein